MGIYIQGSSLFSTLLISLVIGLICTGLLGLMAIHKTVSDFQYLDQRLERNADSGLQLLQSIEGEYNATLDLFDEQQDSVSIGKYEWGLFDIHFATSFKQTSKGQLSKAKAKMLGMKPVSFSKYALYLTDRFKPLTLAGNTKIIGSAALPKAGVKGGYVGGQSYTGDELIYGKTEISKAELPSLITKRLDKWFSISNVSSGLDFLDLKDDTEVSFFQETQKAQSEVVYVTNQSLKGNIAIFSDSLIYIGRNTVVEDVIFHAPQIYIEEGFVGSLQAFATETLVVGRYCELEYPSVLALLQADTMKKAGTIKIAENVSINGLVLAGDRLKKSPSPKVSIETNTLIDGNLYVNGNLELKGNVIGNVICDNFKLRTPSSAYDNHILNVLIDPTSRSEYYVEPIHLSDSKELKLVKWLD